MKQLTLKVGNRARFFLLMSLLYACVLLKSLLQLNILSVAFIVIPALIAITGDSDEIIAICLCCIPFYTVLKFHYIVCISVIVYLVKYAYKIKFGFSLIIVMTLIIWEVLHCFLGKFDLKYLIVFVIPYLFLVVLISTHNIDVDYGFIVRVFSATTCFSCIVFIIRLFIMVEFDIDMSFLLMNRLGQISENETQEFMMNPNTLGVLCTLSITSLLQLKIFNQGKSFDMVMMLIIFVMGLLTLSKTYLACLLIMILMFSIFLWKKGDAKAHVFLRIVGTLLISVIVAVFLFPSVFDAFISRFMVEDITSGRMKLFEQFNEHFVSSPSGLLFGVGMLDFYNKAISVADSVPHNSVQEILFAWGIPGLILIVSFIVAMVLRSKNENRGQQLVNFIPLIIILSKAQVGQMITSNYTMLSFALIYLSLCQDFSTNRQTEQIKSK